MLVPWKNASLHLIFWVILRQFVSFCVILFHLMSDCVFLSHDRILSNLIFKRAFTISLGTFLWTLFIFTLAFELGIFSNHGFLDIIEPAVPLWWASCCTSWRLLQGAKSSRVWCWWIIVTDDAGWPAPQYIY